MIERQTVLEIGGLFGCGKSTLARGVTASILGSVNIEFGDIYKRQRDQVALAGTQVGRDWRDARWDQILEGEMSDALYSGTSLVVANSAFYQQWRRDHGVAIVPEEVRLLNVFLAVDQRIILQRLSERPNDGTDPVHCENAYIGVLRMNRLFQEDNCRDLVLPTDLDRLPMTYREMLRRNGALADWNSRKGRYDSSANDPRWVMLSENISVDAGIGLVQDPTVRTPLEVREYLEGFID